MDMQQLLTSIMKTEGVNLLQAQRVVQNMLSEAVDAIREKYLKDNGLTVEELAARKER